MPELAGGTTLRAGPGITYARPVTLRAESISVDNEWVVGLADGDFLMMALIKITGPTSFSWVETKAWTGFPAYCGVQVSFNKGQCYDPATSRGLNTGMFWTLSLHAVTGATAARSARSCDHNTSQLLLGTRCCTACLPAHVAHFCLGAVSTNHVCRTS